MHNHSNFIGNCADRSRECDRRNPSSFIKPADQEETSRANALKGDDGALNSTQASTLSTQTEGISHLSVIVWAILCPNVLLDYLFEQIIVLRWLVCSEDVLVFVLSSSFLDRV